MGFLMGVNIFRGYGFGIAKPDGFVPVAISTPRERRCASSCVLYRALRTPLLQLVIGHDVVLASPICCFEGPSLTLLTFLNDFVSFLKGWLEGRKHW
jgi:hypothetical protein